MIDDPHDRLAYAALYLIEDMDEGRDTSEAEAYYQACRDEVEAIRAQAQAITSEGTAQTVKLYWDVLGRQHFENWGQGR